MPNVLDTEKYYQSNNLKEQDILDSIKQDSSLPKGYYYLYAKDVEESLKIQTDFHTNAMGYKALGMYARDSHTQYKLSYYNNPLDNIPYPKGTTFFTAPNTPAPTYHTDEKVKICLKGSKTYKNFILNLKKEIERVGVDYEFDRKIKLKNGKIDYPNKTDYTTDHYIVIVGSKHDDKKNLYYLFYDVGTNSINEKQYKAGSNDNNRLFLQNDYSLRWQSQIPSKHFYVITQIRRNIR